MRIATILTFATTLVGINAVNITTTVDCSSSVVSTSEASSFAVNTLQDPTEIIPKDANTHYYEWNLTEKVVSPDGSYRRGFLINGESPGPLIEGKQGDWVIIKVNNFLTVPTTIHFHGIHQNGTIFSDGVPGVTQWPILTGDSYVYVWKMEQYGFYWYHSHMRGYANDGLIGPIYILPADEIERPYSEITEDADLLLELEQKPNYVLVSDWFKLPYDEIAVRMFDFGLDPTCVQSMLINGKGRHYCLPQSTLASDGADKYGKLMAMTNSTTWSMDSYGCLDLGPLNGFTSIDYNKTMLEFPGTNSQCFNTTLDQEVYYTNDKEFIYFNFINMGGEFSKTLNIDDHKITVVAIDGNFINPQTVEQLYLPIGMRISAVVETNPDQHQDVSEPFAIRVSGDDMPQLYTGVAHIQYGNYTNDSYQHVQEVSLGESNGVKFSNLGGTLLNDSYTQLDPFKTSPYDTTLKPPTGAADITIHADLLRLGQTTFSIFNGAAMDGSMELEYPILFKLEANSSINATEAFGGSVVDLGIEEGDVVDIIFQNSAIADHPMHLHAHTFWVLAKNDSIATFGYNTTEEALNDGQSDVFNFEDPAYVDNVAVITGGWAVIRFIARDTIAMIHCHIQTHLTAGMGGVVVEGKTGLDKVPQELLDQNHADFPSGAVAPSELNYTIT